jgi:hypothetical protein
MSSPVQDFTTIVTGVAYYYTYSIAPDSTNVVAEWTAWCLIWLVFRTYRLVRGFPNTEGSEHRNVADIIGGLSIVAFLIRGHTKVELLAPVLPFFVLIAVFLLKTDYRLTKVFNEPKASSFEFLIHTFGLVLVVAVATTALSENLGWAGYIFLSFLYLFVLTGVYTISSQQSNVSSSRWVSESIIEQVSLRVAVIFTAAVLATHPKEIYDISTFPILVAVRAAFLVTTFLMVCLLYLP